MEWPISFGFCGALGGLVVGLFIAWIINALAGTTVVVPGTLGMIVAVLAGLVVYLILIALSALSRDSWYLWPELLGATSGILIPIAAGNILRLHFIEKMSAGTGTHPWKWVRLLLGCVILLVAIRTLANPFDRPPIGTFADDFRGKCAHILAWTLMAGGGLWLIRSGTKRQRRAAPFPSA